MRTASIVRKTNQVIGMRRNELELWYQALLEIFKPTAPGVQRVRARVYWAFLWWNELANELSRRELRITRAVE